MLEKRNVNRVETAEMYFFSINKPRYCEVNSHTRSLENFQRSVICSPHAADGVMTKVKPTLIVKPSSGAQKGQADTAICSQMDSRKDSIKGFRGEAGESVFNGLNTLTMLRKWRKHEK